MHTSLFHSASSLLNTIRILSCYLQSVERLEVTLRDKQRLLEHQTTDRDLLKNRLEKTIGVRTSCHGFMFRKMTASWLE